MIRSRRTGTVIAIIASAALLPAVLASGCTGHKDVTVNRVLEEAGDQESGTGISQVRGDDTDEEREIIETEDGQWARTATASSSFGEVTYRPGWTPEEVAGPPDAPGMGIDGRAWGPREENAGYEWLETVYKTPVHATSVRILEVHAPGSVVMVELKDTEGDYHVKWKGSVEPNPYVTWFVIDFPETDYLVDGVRITLDTTLHASWKQIDAVQLVGAP